MSGGAFVSHGASAEPTLWDLHCNADRVGLFCNWTPDPNLGCYLWTGRQNGAGYGALSVCGRSVLAHRCVYRLLVEDVDLSMEVHHCCGQRACINPRHLIALTPGDHRNVHTGWGSAWVAYVGASGADRHEPLEVFEREFIGLPYRPIVFDIEPTSPRLTDTPREVRR
jgi:hypothetical protein